MQQKQLNTPDDSVEQVTFWQAFLFWLKLGFISFGASWTNRCDASGTG